MQIWLRYGLLLLGALIVFTFPIQTSATQPTLEKNIDRFITHQMTTQHIPGLALAITHKQQALYVKGYGKANTSDPMTPQMQFPIASLSKSFTAVAVMQLVEAGQIDLDAPVQRYLPDFTLANAQAASQITIRQLLNQISGLSDLGFPESLLPQPSTNSERVKSLHRARLVAAPGTEFHYFNPNYDVLARVVEVVSRQSFAEYLRSHLFTPLQMTQTFSATTMTEAQQRADHLATGHLMAFAIPFAAPELSGYLGGSSGVVSTAQDMANYLILHNNQGRFENTTLLSPRSMTLLHNPPAHLDSPYAMGWFATTQNNKPLLQHNGIFSTFYTDVAVLPDEQYSIALLYNISALPLIAFALPQIKTGLIDLLLDRVPAAGGFSINLWGISIAILAGIGVLFAIRSLIRFPQWKRGVRTRSSWRLAVGIGGMFLPAIVLLALPWLLGIVSDRVFGYDKLYRAMVDIMVWLSLCAGLGLINGTIRLIYWAKQN